MDGVRLWLTAHPGYLCVLRHTDGCTKVCILILTCSCSVLKAPVCKTLSLCHLHLYHWSPTTTLRRKCHHHLYFTDEGTVSQRGHLTKVLYALPLLLSPLLTSSLIAWWRLQPCRTNRNSPLTLSKIPFAGLCLPSHLELGKEVTGA